MAEAHRRYLAALFFHGLSNESHHELKEKVHNNALMGSNTVPHTYKKVLQLEDRYKSSYQPRPAGGGGGGVAFAQKVMALGSTPTSTPPDASAKKSLERKPHPAPGLRDTISKMIANASGKKNCFNCRAADHWIVNCPDLTAVQCKELAWMANISIGEDILDGIGFLQNKSTNAAIVATRKTLNLHCLYLDSTYSFYQVFTKEHLNHLNTAGTPSVPTAILEQISPPRKDGNMTFSTFGLSAMASPISYISPNWKTMVSPSVTTLEANGLSLNPNAKTSPSTANQMAYAAAFPTLSCGPHWPWRRFKPSASTTKA
jgi:hypothetical protein